MEKVSSGLVTFDFAGERTIFERTFALLNATLGDHAFTGVDVQGRRPAQFLSLHYEPFSLGLVPHLDQINVANQTQIHQVRDALEAVKNDQGFRAMTTGGGKNFRPQLVRRIEFVASAVATAI